jgi:hypothetical protein
MRQYGRASSKAAIVIRDIANNDPELVQLKFSPISETKDALPPLIYEFSQALLLNTNLYHLHLFMVPFTDESFETLFNALGNV